jgi:hypothetical protein
MLSAGLETCCRSIGECKEKLSTIRHAESVTAPAVSAFTHCFLCLTIVRSYFEGIHSGEAVAVVQAPSWCDDSFAPI